MKNLALILDGCSVEKIFVRKFLASCSSCPEEKSRIFWWATSPPSGLPLDASGWFQEQKWVDAISPLLRFACPGCKSHLGGYPLLCNCGWDQQIISFLLGRFLTRLKNRKQDNLTSHSYMCMQSSLDEQSAVEVPSCKCRICSVLTRALEGKQGSPADVFAPQIRG